MSCKQDKKKQALDELSKLIDEYGVDKVREVSKKAMEKSKKAYSRELISPPEGEEHLISEQASPQAVKFFNRPLISRGCDKLKKIWTQGGKYNVSVLHKEVYNNKSVLAPLFVDLLNDSEFERFLRQENMQRDFPDVFRKALFIFFQGFAVIVNENGTQEGEKEFSLQELKNMFNSVNKYRLQEFIHAILEYKKWVKRNKK